MIYGTVSSLDLCRPVSVQACGGAAMPHCEGAQPNLCRGAAPGGVRFSSLSWQQLYHMQRSEETAQPRSLRFHCAERVSASVHAVPCPCYFMLY